MAIDVKPETYETASDILTRAKDKLGIITSEIESIYSSLDSNVKSYVSSDINIIINNLSSINTNTHNLAQRINNKAQDFVNIEKKASSKVNMLGNVFDVVTTPTMSGKMGVIASKVLEPGVETIFVDKGVINNFPEQKENWVTEKIESIGTDSKTGEDTGFMKAVKGTSASLTNGATGVLHGLVRFGESAVDAEAIILTAYSSKDTLKLDAVNFAKSKIFDTEWESDTQKMWNNTKGFVQENFTEDVFSVYHEKDLVGSWSEEKSYSPFKSTGAAYKVADGVGYLGGTIALSAATLGLGGAASGTTTALDLGVATVEVTPNAIATGSVAGVAGLGKNTQEAWNDGASTTEGLAYGTAMGAWEGFEMFLGAEINTLKVSGVKGVTGQLINTGSHVVLDTIDGASAEVIKPLFNMIYTPNEENATAMLNEINYDQNGNQIADKAWDDLTFSEKYESLFKKNGGWGNVATSGLSAGVVSLFTEVPDVAQSISSSNVVKTWASNGVNNTVDSTFSAFDKFKKTFGLKTEQTGNIGDIPKTVQIKPADNIEKTVEILPEKGVEKTIQIPAIDVKKIVGIVDEKVTPVTKGLADRSKSISNLGVTEEIPIDFNTQIEHIIIAEKTDLSNLDIYQVNDLGRSIETMKNRLIQGDLSLTELSKKISLDKQIDANMLIYSDAMTQKLKKYFPSMNKGYLTLNEVSNLLDSNSAGTYQLVNNLSKRLDTSVSKELQTNIIKGLKFGTNGSISIPGASGRVANQALAVTYENMLSNNQTSKAAVSSLRKLTSEGLSNAERFKLISDDLVKSTNPNIDNSFTRVYSAIQDAYVKGNKNIALHNLEALQAVNGEKSVRFALDPSVSCVRNGNQLLLTSYKNSKNVSLHEFGHLMHSKFANYEVPNDIGNVIMNAQNNGAKNINALVRYQADNVQRNKMLNAQGAAIFDKYMINKYGSTQAAMKAIESEIKNTDISTLLKQNGIDDGTINQVLSNNFTTSQIANVIYQARRRVHADVVARSNPGSAVSDIIAAIYRSDSPVIRGQKVPLTYGHATNYWDLSYQKSFKEMIANFNDLVAYNKVDDINFLRNTFGNDLINKIIEVYNKTY